MIEEARAHIRKVTGQILEVVLNGDGDADVDCWAERIARRLSRHFHVPYDWVRSSAVSVFSQYMLSEADLRALSNLIVERCLLSLQVAREKAKELSNPIKDRDELMRWLTVPEVEEKLIREALKRVDARDDEVVERMLDLMNFLFRLAKEAQVSYITARGSSNRRLKTYPSFGG